VARERDQIRIALIGLGDIGVNAHLPAILAEPRVELVAIADADAVRVHRCAAALDATTSATTDVTAVLTGREVDAVVLATPPWVTTTLARSALRAGKSVLAEKPIALSLADAAPLLELDEASRARLQIGFTYRHHPALERLRDLVSTGSLGAPMLFRIAAYDEAADPSNPEHDARIRATLAHGMPIVHEGAHFCDWLNLVLQTDPTDVQGLAIQTDPTLPAPNLNVAFARYPDGTVAVLETGWLLPALPPCHFTVSGPRGGLTIDFETMALTGTIDGRLEHLDPHEDRTHLCFRLQLARFVEAARSGRAMTPGLAEAMASLEYTERIVCGMQTASSIGSPVAAPTATVDAPRCP
jgi:myo-inositol 2-dehydrogenase / D-chiro-inositol 1-dehydrogenase